MFNSFSKSKYLKSTKSNTINSTELRRHITPPDFDILEIFKTILKEVSKIKVIPFGVRSE